MKQKKIQTYGIRSKGMTTIEIQKETKVHVNTHLSFFCDVKLSDNEQIIQLAINF